MLRIFLIAAMSVVSLGACSTPTDGDNSTNITNSTPIDNAIVSNEALGGDEKPASTAHMELRRCVELMHDDPRCYEGRTPLELKSEVDRRVQMETSASVKANPVKADLCWEGYCPCKPPQGGPDQLLCDQLRMGKVDPEMLSAGKSMRDVRRQIDEYQF